MDIVLQRNSRSAQATAVTAADTTPTATGGEAAWAPTSANLHRISQTDLRILATSEYPDMRSQGIGLYGSSVFRSASTAFKIRPRRHLALNWRRVIGVSDEVAPSRP